MSDYLPAHLIIHHRSIVNKIYITISWAGKSSGVVKKMPVHVGRQEKGR